MIEAKVKKLKHTPLYDLHIECGAKMVIFAGYNVPVQYPAGVLREHLHTREQAGLFDVSHMGQAWLTGDDPAAALEQLVAADLAALEPGQQRYSQLLNDNGGIVDDLMITRPDDPDLQDRLYLVVNAVRKQYDFELIAKKLAGQARLEEIPEQALLAVQGPKAVEIIARLFGEELRAQAFMKQAALKWQDTPCLVSRSGYTGEDGFEISLAASEATALARTLLEQPEILPVGLGARDTLRLEAGLCLYGSDIDEATTPVEAGLGWSIGARRRAQGGFPGAAVIQKQLHEGAPRLRVGIRPEGRTPARTGTEITDPDGNIIGRITSGGYAPSLKAPIAMGYVSAAHKSPGTPVCLMVRGRSLPAHIAALPFSPHHYWRNC